MDVCFHDMIASAFLNHKQKWEAQPRWVEINFAWTSSTDYYNITYPGAAYDSHPTDGVTGNVCPLGHFCPVGSAMPLFCKDGTYANFSKVSFR